MKTIKYIEHPVTMETKKRLVDRFILIDYRFVSDEHKAKEEKRKARRKSKREAEKNESQDEEN